MWGAGVDRSGARKAEGVDLAQSGQGSGPGGVMNAVEWKEEGGRDGQEGRGVSWGESQLCKNRGGLPYNAYS